MPGRRAKNPPAARESEGASRVARVVPQIMSVGGDIVVTPVGPVRVEGNGGAGVYENKPSVTGIRTGHKPRYREAIGF